MKSKLKIWKAPANNADYMQSIYDATLGLKKGEGLVYFTGVVLPPSIGLAAAFVSGKGFAEMVQKANLPANTVGREFQYILQRN